MAAASFVVKGHGTGTTTDVVIADGLRGRAVIPNR